MNALVLGLLLQSSGAIDSAATSVRGLDSRKIAPVDDAVFLERVTRDLWGEGAADPKRFVNDPAPDKRARKVDELLASPKFAEHWGRRLAAPDGPELAAWIAAALAADRPWTETAADMVRGKSPWTRPTEKERALDVGRRFLGVRLYCATCHDHPYDRWTVNDAYGLAAFFTEKDLRIPRTPDGDDQDAKVKLANGETVAPAFLFGGTPLPGEARRDALARLLTAPANTQLPRAFANRVWAELFGKGVVHPFDDFNLRNKASSPALLDTLTRAFVSGGYRLKPLLRDILSTRIYQSVDLTEPEKSEWSSFRGMIVGPPDPTLRAFKPFTLDIPKTWTPLGPVRPYLASAFRVPGGARFGATSTTPDAWANQIVGAKPLSETFAGPVKVTLTEFAGTFSCDMSSGAPLENWSVLHARLVCEKGTKNVLLEGPSDVVRSLKPEFLEMLKKASFGW